MHRSMAGDLRRCGARARFTGLRGALGNQPGSYPPGEVSRICRQYDAVLPDEAPAGVTPEPPPWLMASTGRPSRRSPAVNRWLLPGHTWQERQLNVYYVAAIWLGMALLASMVSIWIAVPAALVEIVVGALAGNIPGISQHVSQTGFVTFLAGVGSLVLTFLGSPSAPSPRCSASPTASSTRPSTPSW